MYASRPNRIFLCMIRLLPFFCVLLFGTSCSDNSTHPPEFRLELQQEMDRFLDEKMSEYNIPGAVIGIFVPGRGTWLKAKGKADIEANKDMNLTHTLRIGSISKTFNATIILQLVDEGLLNLEDTLNRFVPWVPNSENITIRQLCNNTSGIFNYGEDHDLNMEYVNSDFLAHYTPEELVRVAIGHEPYFPPGKGFHYSNTNFVLLAMIIEMVTGNTFKEALEKRIFKTLNLNNTTFPVDQSIHMTGNYSHGYLEADGVLKDYTVSDHSIQWGAGGIISDLSDLELWAEVLGEGLLISKEMQDERLKWSPHSESGIFKYGMGVFYLGDFVGHDGGCIGFNTALFYLPSKKATFIILLNQSNDYSGAINIFLGFANKVFPGIFQMEDRENIPTTEHLPLEISR
ncbi:MAG: beta-lactamase family protein [Nitrospina sp.]|nr:beta-lactamase family protein [Nitrospina sp.]